MERALYQDALVAADDDPALKVRLVSLSHPMVGAWLVAPPTSPDLCLTNSDFRLASRLRLGLRPYDDLPSYCLCSAQFDLDGLHSLSCRLLRRTAATTRHDMVVNFLAATLRRLGAEVFVEPKDGGGQQGVPG